MQKFTQKYTLAQLLENLPEGTTYDWRHWPLHVTIADVFATHWDEPTMIKELTDFLKTQEFFTTTTGDDTLLGPEQQTRVALLQSTTELQTLHNNVVALLERGGAAFNHPEFTREGFLPHSTVLGDRRLHKGDVVPFTALTLIDMFPDDDPYKRRILKTMPLSN